MPGKRFAKPLPKAVTWILNHLLEFSERDTGESLGAAVSGEAAAWPGHRLQTLTQLPRRGHALPPGHPVALAKLK